MVLDQYFLVEHMMRHQICNTSIALLGFKENITWADYRSDAENIRSGLRIPDYRRDLKFSHLLKKDEAPFKYKSTRFIEGDAINYMEQTDYLRGLAAMAFIDVYKRQQVFDQSHM